MRAGRIVQQPQGGRAFVPALSPPERPVRLEGEGTALLGAGHSDRLTAVLHLCEDGRRKLASNALGEWVLGHLFEQPVMSGRAAEQYLGCSFATAGGSIEQLERVGLLRRTPGQQKRNRLYRYEPYLELFEQHGIHMETQELGQVSGSEADHG